MNALACQAAWLPALARPASGAGCTALGGGAVRIAHTSRSGQDVMRKPPEGWAIHLQFGERSEPEFRGLDDRGKHVAANEVRFAVRNLEARIAQAPIVPQHASHNAGRNQQRRLIDGGDGLF